MTISSSRWPVRALSAALALVALAACNAPFSLPSTRALEDGVVASLATAKSFEITGTYSEAAFVWTIDMQLVPASATAHVTVSKPGLSLEAILIGGDAYFRGNEFLSQRMGSDPTSRNLVKVAGNGWWRGSAVNVPQLPDFTQANNFRTTFLGTAVTERTDHVSVGGVDGVALAGPRARVVIESHPPYRLLGVTLQKKVVVDGISDADLRFEHFDQDFGIAAPSDVIDFAHLSTLPPLYTVVSVNTSRCGTPCVVSAVLKNLGGKLGAQAPSVATFTMVNPASTKTVGTCQAVVQPDVDFNLTTTVTCTIDVGGQTLQASRVTAVVDNPGHA
jgi:hypothetical protein